MRWWRFMRKVYRAANHDFTIDFVFATYLDTFLHALAVLGSPFYSICFGGIVFTQRFHLKQMGVPVSRSRPSRVRAFLFRRAIASQRLESLCVIDDTLRDFVISERWAGADRIRYVPDPSDDPPALSREHARSQFQIDDRAVVVLVYGFLDSRKNLSALIAWLSSDRVSSKVCGLLVGKMSPDTRELLRSNEAERLCESGRLVSIDRYVTQAEEAQAFEASDIVWLAYRDIDLMSGVIVKAALHEKPVVVQQYGLIYRYARTYGATLSEEQCENLGVMRLPDRMQMRGFGRKFDGCRNIPDHSWENACAVIFDSRVS
jgi:hypothetical protein